MLRFENHANGRFYYIYSKKDLLNDYVLLINRGGRGRGVVILRGYPTAREREAALAEIARRRIRNGYSLVT